MTLVVDASVAAKWFFQEAGSDQAQQLWDGGEAIHAPDLLLAELANVCWKRYRRGEITLPQAMQIIDTLRRLPLTLHDVGELVLPALDVACRLGLTVYDAVYLTLATTLPARLATADTQLASACRRCKLEVVTLSD